MTPQTLTWRAKGKVLPARTSPPADGTSALPEVASAHDVLRELGALLAGQTAGTEFGLERLTGLIIPAMAAENSLRGAGPADPGDP